MTNRLNDLKETIDAIYEKWESLDKLYWDSLVETTLDWFKYYQWNEDPDKMVKLYEELIKEEREEIYDAWKNKDIIEVLDWIVDYIWVNLWHMYFRFKRGDYKDLKEEEFIRKALHTSIIVLSGTMVEHNILKLAWLEILYSNWTKSLDKKKTWKKKWKIIKGENYVAPDLEKVFNYFNK